MNEKSREQETQNRKDDCLIHYASFSNLRCLCEYSSKAKETTSMLLIEGDQALFLHVSEVLQDLSRFDCSIIV